MEPFWRFFTQPAKKLLFCPRVSKSFFITLYILSNFIIPFNFLDPTRIQWKANFKPLKFSSRRQKICDDSMMSVSGSWMFFQSFGSFILIFSFREQSSHFRVKDVGTVVKFQTERIDRSQCSERFRLLNFHKNNPSYIWKTHTIILRQCVDMLLGAIQNNKQQLSKMFLLSPT